MTAGFGLQQQQMNYLHNNEYQVTGQEQWTSLTPQVTIEELKHELVDIVPLERHYEFCRYNVYYGIADALSELSETAATKGKLSRMESDMPTIEEEIKRLRNFNHELSLQRGYGHQNHPSNPTAYNTHEGVSHMNQQGQWGMAYGSQYGNQGHPPQPAHPSLLGSGLRMGANALGFPFG